MAELDNKLNDPLGISVPIPKTVKEATSGREKYEGLLSGAYSELGKAEEAKATQAPLAKQKYVEAQKAYLQPFEKQEAADIESAQKDMANFKVSQDSITGMSALGTSILMLGQLLGKSGGQQSAMGAIQGMTGMMQGYNKGRADEFKRGQLEFERNFKILQDKIKQAKDKLKEAIERMPYNTIEAETLFNQEIAKLDSDIARQKTKIQGLNETYKMFSDAEASLIKMLDLAKKNNLLTPKEVLPEIQGVRAINNLEKQLDDPEVRIGLTAKLAPFKEKMASIFKNDKADFENTVNATLTGTDKTTLFLKNALLETYAIERAAKGGQRLTVQDMKMVGPVLDPTNYKPETYRAILEDRRRSLYNSLQDKGMSQEEINKRAAEHPYTPYGGEKTTTSPQKSLSQNEIADLRAKADARIKAGADPEAVKKKFKELTGQDY